MLTRRNFLAFASCFAAAPARAEVPRWGRKLIAAAESQLGRTVIYDPAYVKLAYPGGDLPIERGVCTDVIVRAYRDGLGLDLQKLVHEDMRVAFQAYPKTWGLSKPDRNIDHRRVPNLQTFFTRKGAALAVREDAAAYAPGDLMTMMLPGNLPHIGIVSDQRTEDGARPLLIHNIGAGAKRDDVLASFRVTGRYRYFGNSAQ
ncbi:MAG: DUF1287 domain-containing protein [Aestuariivirga sp.]